MDPQWSDVRRPRTTTTAVTMAPCYPAPGQPADPAHAPGYVVPGRDVWATRIVYEDGAELWTDVWYSHYAPVWGGPAR